MSVIAALLARDFRLCVARGADAFVAVFFFVLVCALFPFALGAEASVLRAAAAGIIWIAALLAALLTLEAVWHRDEEDGTLDLLLLSGVAPLRLVAAKVMSHLLVAGLPLVLGGAVAALMLQLTGAALLVLLPSLAMGAVYMALLGALGAALTLGARRPGLLMVILVLPLYLPMLIAGLMAAQAALAGMAAKPYLLLQAALMLAALPLAPLCAAAVFSSQSRSA